MTYIELATGNKGKTVQAERAASQVIELTSRQGLEASSYFDEDAIKKAVETGLNIPRTQPFKYALAISQLKMMKHSAEMADREPAKAKEAIPLVTDSIAVAVDENGHYLAINRDDLGDPAFRERVTGLTNMEQQLSFSGFASFAFPGDENVYTVPTFLDVDLNRSLLPSEIPVSAEKMPEVADKYAAGYLRLEEPLADEDFTTERVLRTSTTNWNTDNLLNRHEAARQYMGGTTYGLMELIRTMKDMNPEDRSVFNGDMGNGNVVPFRTINRNAYADIVASLPTPGPSK